jgi:stage II sporulation protein M
MKDKFLKPYIFAISALFFGAILQGYILAAQNKEMAQAIISGLAEDLSFLGDTPSAIMFLFIFLNNSIKTFFSLVLGFFFGLIPLLFIVINGLVIGLVIYIVSQDIGFLKIILGILPHGIFEIYATILTQAIGLWLGIKFYKKLIKNEPFKPHLMWALKKYFKLALPLLLGAALIEAFITPLLI